MSLACQYRSWASSAPNKSGEGPTLASADVGATLGGAVAGTGGADVAEVTATFLVLSAEDVAVAGRRGGVALTFEVVALFTAALMALLGLGVGPFVLDVAADKPLGPARGRANDMARSQVRSGLK